MLMNFQGLQMTFSRFVRYFERRTKRRILNLLSLEFGDTALSGKIPSFFFCTEDFLRLRKQTFDREYH